MVSVLQDAVVPDSRLPFNWLECYREGLYAQSETAHKEAKREGEPREPEMRVVLEGTLKEAPKGAWEGRLDSPPRPAQHGRALSRAHFVASAKPGSLPLGSGVGCLGQL